MEISGEKIKEGEKKTFFLKGWIYSLMTNPCGEKTAVQMQDDPLSEFPGSVNLRADGSLKPQKRERGFKSLKMANCM